MGATFPIVDGCQMGATFPIVTGATYRIVAPRVSLSLRLIGNRTVSGLVAGPKGPAYS